MELSSSRFWFIATSLGLFFNGSFCVFTYWYVYSGVHPNRNAINVKHSGWEGYSIMLHVYGFLLGCFNIWFFSAIRDTVIPLIRTHRIKCRFSFRMFLLFSQFLAVPIACFFSIAPISTPFVAIKMAQTYVWNTACTDFPLEIILYGRNYRSPDSQPIASFFYLVNGIRTQFYSYAISRHNDSDNWTFDLQGVSPGIEVPENLYPFISEVAYDASSHTVLGACSAGVNTSTSPCLEGQYDDAPFLSFNVTDMQTRTMYLLRASDTQSFYPDNSDGPSLILHDVESNGDLGPEALQTAVTGLDCSRLKICSFKVSGPDLIVSVGRILMAQDSYSFSCTKPSV